MSFMEIQNAQETTDVGDVWHKAIQQYCVETGQDIKAAGSSHGWSVDAILREQKEEVDKFAKFRHNKGTLDQVRSSINRNTDIILAVAKQVSNAASTSFPPAATILTAFTWVMKAANDVSSDYDMIGSFFDIMGSFLERISLLESKMPAVTAYQNVLMRVFSSLLTLCSIATSYGKNGRFSKWAKALVKGNDPKLTGAYGGLNTNIQRLESATMFATLGQTIETQRTLSRVEAIASEGLLVTKQGLAAMEEMSIAVKSGNLLDQDTNTMVRDLQSLVKSMKGREEKIKVDPDDSKAGKVAKSKDAGARRSEALNQVQTAFSSAAKPSIQLKNIQLSFVTGTLKWISDEASWGRFLDGQDAFLWICGDRGMGKSNCAYWAAGWLNDHFHHDERTSVAYFFFREEHEELRSVTNLLKAIAIQIATIDGKFREDTAAELRRRKSEGLDIAPSNEDDMWNDFLASKYPKGGEAKLYLVIDGLDEADEKDRNKLVELLEQAKKDSLQIHTLVTGRPSLNEKLKVLEPAILNLTTKLLSNDIKTIINARWKSLSKLKRMKPNLRKQVIRRLRQRADSVLYVEHVLARLNSIGREALILKELDKLPDSLSELYHSLLLECQKSRTPEEFASLKRLFAWLAYSKRPLTLGEASNLFSLVDTKGTLIIEEEIDGKSARLLRLAQIGADEDQSSEESDNDDSGNDDEINDQTYFDTDSSTHLRFQERSLRQYFREINVDDHGLRSSPSSAHLMIFEMIAKILTLTEGAPLHESETAVQLKDYAANFWLQHFLDIEESNATDEDVKFVIKSLYSIFNNQGRALEKIEEFSEQIGIFGETRASAIPAIEHWVKRARNFDPEVLGGEEWGWAESISKEPTNLIKGIARRHIENWYTYATNQEESYRSFMFAEYALKMTDLLADESPKITEEYILLVSNAFPDIPKTSSSYRAIGMSMKYVDLYEAGLRLCRRAVETATTDKERFDSLNSLAEAAVTLAKSKKRGDVQSEETKDTIGAEAAQRDQWAREATEAIEAAVTLCASFNKENNELHWKQGLLNLYVVRAQCQLLAKEFDAAIISIDEARSFFPDDAVDYEVLNEITMALEDNGDYEKLMAFVEKFNRIDRLIWLNDEIDNNMRFQLAASRSKKPDSLVAIYEGVIKHLDHFKYGGAIRLELASYYQYVTGDFDKAKVLIYEIFKKKGLGDGITEGVVLNARSALADILIEQTRSTSDPDEKTRLLNEMKTLAYKNSAILATDFNADASQTAVTTALMLRKMGPLQEFQSVLNKSFDSCIEALNDAYGWNDNITFRLLARVLACIPGLERDAQIALVCQFYIVDPKFKQQPKSDDSVDLPETEVNDKPVATNEGAEQNPPVYTEFAEDKPKEEAKDEKVEDNSDEDLDPAWAVICNGCNKYFRHLHDAVAYNCIICTEVDLCSDCYFKRVSWNNGEPNKDWRSFCGKKHHYIKQPPEGWKGVKDGVISLGDEKLEFKEWLGTLQGRWEEAWKQFWLSERVEDIL